MKIEIKSPTYSWLTSQLQAKIRKVFESRYKRVLTDFEVEEIGENLEAVTEELLKLKWRQKYGISNA